MADEKEIKQNIIINVEETGVNEATKSVKKLDDAVDDLSDANKNLSKTNNDVHKSFDEVYKDLKPLTSRMGEAEDRLYELALAGKQATEEYQGLLKVVAEYKRTQQETDRVVDAAATTIGQKLGGATALATTGITSVVSGMALFGDQSEQTEQTLLKVQAAMAFSDSISSLSEMNGQWQDLKSTILQSSVAQRLFNLVAKANPYALAATVITAAVAAIYTFIKVTGEAAKKEEEAKASSEKLTTAIENQSKAYENNSSSLSKSNDHKIDLLRASGASEKQIYAETKALKEQELQLAKNFRAEAIRSEQRAYELNRDNPTEFTKKTLADAKENIKKAEKAVSDGYDSLIQLQNNYEIAKVQAATNARTKEAQEAESARTKAIEKEKEDRKKAKEKAIQDAKDLRKSEAQALIDLDKELIAADKDRTDKKAAEYAEFEALRLQRLKEDADKEVEIEKNKAAQKKSIQEGQINLVEKAVGFLSAIAGKNKALQKAAIIAESALGIGRSVISTNASNVAAVAEGAALAIPTGGASVAAASSLVTGNYVALGLGIASNVAATTKALQSLGGGSAPSASGGGNIKATPTRNVAQVGFQASSENQIASSIARNTNEQPPLKAFVVSTEVTTQQQLDNAKLLQNKI